MVVWPRRRRAGERRRLPSTARETTRSLSEPASRGAIRKLLDCSTARPVVVQDEGCMAALRVLVTGPFVVRAVVKLGGSGYERKEDKDDVDLLDDEDAWRCWNGKREVLCFVGVIQMSLLRGRGMMDSSCK